MSVIRDVGAAALGSTVSARPLAGDMGGTLLHLAITPASARERKVAWGVAGISLLVFVAAIPFAKEKLVEVPSFIPAYVTALFCLSLVTAVILIGQFVRLRSLALLALAAGYLYDAAVLVPYTLAFPGLVRPGTLIGDHQTTPWMFVFWHGGFPLFAAAYALIRDSRFEKVLADPLRAVVGAAALVAVLVLVLTLLAINVGTLLPPILVGNAVTPAGFAILGSAWAVSAIALVVLWRRGIRSSLEVWLAVVLFAWVCDIGLSAVLNAGRYDLGYYFGRLYGLLALSFVLGVVLLETTGLHGLAVETAARLSTAVRESQERERATSDQLRQAQKMEAIGNLTGGMAHDFNNLLGIVIGNLDILVERRNTDPEVRELAGEALDAALRGADLTKHLLAFARRQPLQPQQVDLNVLIANITRLLSRTLGENIEISLDLDPGLWQTVVDPSQLESALANLATNARDAMPDGGSLVFATGNRHLDADYAAEHIEVAPGDYAMIEVADTGAGMAPEIAQRIFEPFFTTKGVGKGSGLGLSMVYGFIKQSQGHINVYSEPGIGTTFRLYLPRAVVDGEVSLISGPAAEAVSGNGETVLAVEDNASLRRVVVRQLREMGYRVLEADSAASALSVLEEEPIDLLFTDVVMAGGMSGIDLARDAQRRWPDMKVLITSGFPETKLNGSGPSVARLLTKPYRKDELAQAIREILSG
jgi:signal transduction histidine kinase